MYSLAQANGALNNFTQAKKSETKYLPKNERKAKY
jgi:hypothetical protein